MGICTSRLSGWRSYLCVDSRASHGMGRDAKPIPWVKIVRKELYGVRSCKNNLGPGAGR